MQDPYKIDFKEELELTIQDKKFLKRCGRVYSLLSFCEIPAAIAFGIFKMPIASVACGITSLACAIGVIYLKIEEKEVDKEICDLKKRVEKQQKEEKTKN